MSASAADWTTAAATCVLALGAIVAGVYAVRTYGAQSRQLDVARAEARRQRTPVLRAVIDVIDHGDIAKFRLDAWLSTPEALGSLRVVIEEARAHDCPLGFTPGQTGVDQNPDQNSLPPGWRNDVLRHEARWDERLVPGRAATWQMALRDRAPGVDADPGKVRLRAECVAGSGGEPWLVEVPVSMTEDTRRWFPAEPGASMT